MTRPIRITAAATMLLLAALAIGFSATAQTFEEGMRAYRGGDYDTAFRAFQHLADGGDRRAQGSLGDMYRKGYGVTQDHAEAMKWYLRAADQGSAHAQDGLGLMYRDGLGVPPHAECAYIWFDLAAHNFSASRGNRRDRAAGNRDRIAASLSRQGLERAQRTVGQWRPGANLDCPAPLSPQAGLGNAEFAAWDPITIIVIILAIVAVLVKRRTRSSRRRGELEALRPPASEPGARPMLPEVGSVIAGKAFVGAATLPGRPEPTTTTPNDPANVLSAWLALEALSPQTFRDRSEFRLGKRQVLEFDIHAPPWMDTTANDRHGDCFYQVVLGSISMERAFGSLVATYGDRRPERPVADGEAILASLTVDGQGFPIGVAGISVSCFAWALPIALNRRLDRLDGWTAIARDLSKQMHSLFQPQDADGETEPLNGTTLNRAYEWLLGRLEIDRAMVIPPTFCIRSPRKNESSPPPAPLLLDSFFLDDLVAARRLFAADKASPVLRNYLQVEPPAKQFPLASQERRSVNAARGFTLPGWFPPARWPGRGRFPLVLNQQLAVNTAFRTNDNQRLLAVNGPPGTGKTTLLRDIVAANVVRRAGAMAQYAQPSDAFSSYRESTIKVDGRSVGYYPVAPKIRGFEMLVVSSNNKAVENVTAELPGMEAIAEDAPDLRYFKTLSDHLLKPRETWGLMAAVLGSGGNRRAFRNAFWWDKDVGLRHYLDFVSPRRSRPNRPAPPKNPDRFVIRNENPPADPASAQSRWQQAQRRFREADEAARRHITRLQTVWSFMNRENVRKRDRRGIADRQQEHQAGRPGWLARVFWTRRYRRWRQEDRQIADAAAAIEQEYAKTGEALATAAPELLRDLKADQPISQYPSGKPSPSDWFGAVKEAMGDRLMDRSFDKASHAEQQLRTPWLDKHAHRLRDDVFIAAVHLHKAFIDGAAKQLKANLDLLMDLFAGKKLTFNEAGGLVHLWASLFLVTPVASSTFASVRRMLDGLPPASLGWLLVDEAGQAVPQAAVGALMRTKRAVVVGDPLQIEPVVTLPDGFTPKVFEHFDVDASVFNAPDASVQTLADSAGPFAGHLGSATVGVPLLVHRRCMDPMFSISNRVAYEDLMVSGVRAGTSAIGEILGESTWLDVQGSGSGDGRKWCKEEGDCVVSLLSRLTALGEPPDIHIITPFRVVQDRLREHVRGSGVLTTLGISDQDQWVRNRVGTVHTFQGREAEAVIFVLGAPEAERQGTRQWAGGRPNLLNVAVSRAKKVLYVVGNRELWRTAGCFEVLDELLP